MTNKEAIERLRRVKELKVFGTSYMPALDLAISALVRDRWISVEERLPPLFDETYLVALAWGGVGTMEFKHTGFHNYGSFSPVPIGAVTHWRPLPEPPKEDKP